MGTSQETFDDNSLFSKVEQNRLHMFLDGLDGGNTFTNPTTTTNTNITNAAPTPILLSSPFKVGGTNNTASFHHPIHINSLLPCTKITKKYQQKKMSPYSPTPSSSTTTSSSSDENHHKKPSSSVRKMTHELLSEEQKKANHIASEQKRRANIRVGFEKLVDIVPTLSSGYRSEALILQKSVEHLRQLVDSKNRLKEKARELQLMLGEIPDNDSSEGEIDYEF